MKKSKAQVQGTNDFNTVSKCSMVKSGYFRDDYVSYFVTRCNRRAPLIHLGYYMRVLTVDYTLQSFLDSILGRPAQIISCGAGFDTSFFRLAANGSVYPELYFYEVDFAEVVDRKAECILGSQALQDCIGSFEVNQNGVRGLVSSQYRLIASDLQALDKLEANLIQAGVSFCLPTLMLTECSICYMDETSSSLLIQWAASRFADATFVTYEQMYPDDGFGIVMQKHFQSMNSPLLSLAKFPDLESQERRYVSQGWRSCSVWTAFEMFQQIASPEERLKIINLEPFDELEEWHLEGCHFGLIVASKGSLTDWFLKFVDLPPRMGKCARRPCIQWELVEPASAQNVRRFAQKTVKVQEEDGFDIIVVGGFGPSAESRHGRRHEVLSIHGKNERSDGPLTGNRTLNVADVALDAGVNLDMLHHTCTRLSVHGPDGTTRVMVYGGRYSPRSAVNVWPLIVSVSSHDVGTSLTVANGHVAVNSREGVSASSRWRHSAVCLKPLTPTPHQDYIVVFGGRTPDFEVLADVLVWTVRASDMSVGCREVARQRDWPGARFSHSAAVWHEQTMIVSGGLGQEMLPLGDIWCFSLEAEMWSALRVDGMLPRYSHTSAVYGDRLILIGGVNTLPGMQPGVCVVDLNTASCSEYALPAQNPACPIMLHNHSSEVVDSETAVLVVGGGGNCFSFGTAFNSCMIRIDLLQFR